MHYLPTDGDCPTWLKLENFRLWPGTWRAAFSYRGPQFSGFGWNSIVDDHNWDGARTCDEGGIGLGSGPSGRVACQMAGVEQVSMDRMRTLVNAELRDGERLLLRWSDGVESEIPLATNLAKQGQPVIGDWGHSLQWLDGTEIGADRLWLDTLTAIGRDDARQFLEWRLRNGLSLAKAAEALGLARRTIAYYSNGDRPVPKAILLACKGWEASPELRKAA